ncbi:GPALPP motifs-containing protein 1 [Lycorma delicatula]|uniref:GPALPP motifs-containing protein 1 n=1 Tax=Lycorma delicatula TaxID=130591 RepID=UPI003F50F6DB
MSQSDSIIGPVVPGSVLNSCSETKELVSELTNKHNKIDCCTLDTVSAKCDSTEKIESRIIGPALPLHLKKQFEGIEDSNLSKDDDNNFLNNTTDCDLYGPALPPHLKKTPVVISSSQEFKHNSNFVERNVSAEDDNEDVIGPLPDCVNKGEMSLSQRKLEIRARYLKQKMAEEGSEVKEKIARESWMVELPPERAKSLGLGPRSFRMKEGPDMSDRSDWTDTPADRERKLLLQNQASCDSKTIEEDMKIAIINERDKKMEKMAEKCKNEKRQLSLLEIHQKKLKKQQKEKKKRGEKPERRPFDRNIDLQANRFDEAQKKSIFKKAQLLDTRFSQGQSKYL